MKIATTENNKEKIIAAISTSYQVTNSKCNLHNIKSPQNLSLSKQVLGRQSIIDDSVIDYVRLTDNQMIVLTTNGVWINTSVDHDSFLPRLSTGKINNIETTKKLLDTAIVLGKRAASVKQQLPALSLKNWVWSLVSQYHVAHSTPQLMREAAWQFSEQGRHCLAKWSEEKAEEETGHDRLALQDIQSLGYQAQALVNAHLPPSAKILVDYFSNCVRTTDPIKVVGYAYTLERIALAIKDRHLKVIKNIIPPGVKATRCLQVHSSVGSDVEHVDEALETIAQLSVAERNQIAIACYETAQLYFSTRKQDFPSKVELEQKLQFFQH